jgi:hypothetical protein
MAFTRIKTDEKTTGVNVATGEHKKWTHLPLQSPPTVLPSRSLAPCWETSP